MSAADRVIEILMVILIVAIVAFGGLAVTSTVDDYKKWETFKGEHACKVVGQTAGDMSVNVGLSTSGHAVVVPTGSPPKTGWLCDDGITYWR